MPRLVYLFLILIKNMANIIDFVGHSTNSSLVYMSPIDRVCYNDVSKQASNKYLFCVFIFMFIVFVQCMKYILRLARDVYIWCFKAQPVLIVMDPDRIPQGEGGLLVDFLMEDPIHMQYQSELDSLDLKRDRANSRERKFTKKDERQRQALEARIRDLNRKREVIETRMEAKRNARLAKMESQAGMDLGNSEFVSKLCEFEKALKSHWGSVLISEATLRILVVTLIHAHLVYKLRDKPMEVIELALLYMERVIPAGKFTEWAPHIKQYLLDCPQQLNMAASKKVSEARGFLGMDNQAEMSKFDKVSAIMKSDSLLYVKRVVGLLVGIGLAPTCASIGGIKIFSDKCFEKCDSMEDIFTVAVSSVDYFSKVGRKFFQTGVWTDLMFENVLESVHGRMSLCNEKHALMQGEEVDLEDFAILLKETKDFITRRVKSETPQGKAILLRHLASLDAMSVAVRSRQKGFTPEKAPPGVCVWGDSSVGKSSVMYFTSETAARALGEGTFIGCTAYLNSATKYDDSINSNTKCVVEDDVNYAVQAVAECVQGSTAMDIINNWPKFTNQAELEKKGIVRKIAKFYMSSCNSQLQFIQGSLNCKEALYRRVDAINVKVKAAAQTPDGRLNSEFVLDALDVDADGHPQAIPDTVWLITYAVWDFRNGAYRPIYAKYEDNHTITTSSDPIPGGFEVRDVDLSVYLDVLYSKISSHSKKQDVIKKFLGAGIPNCEHGVFASTCRRCHPARYDARKASALIPNAVPGRPVPDRSAVPMSRIGGFGRGGRMQNQVGFARIRALFKPPVVNPINVGTALMNGGYGMFIALSPSQKANVVIKTAWLWRPVLIFLAAYRPRYYEEQWKIRASFVFFYSIFIAVIWPLYSYDCRIFYMISCSVVLMLWALYSIVVTSLQVVCADAIAHARRDEWANVLTASGKALYSWKWYLISGITSLVLAASFLKRSWSNEMEEQAGEEVGYTVPYNAECKWAKKSGGEVPRAELTGATVEQVVEKISFHTAYITADVKEGRMFCHAMPFKNGTWITNAHFLREVENVKMVWRSGNNVREIRITRNDWVLVREESDIALVHIRWPSMPDMSGYITKDISSDPFPAKWISKQKDLSTTVLDIRCDMMPRHMWGQVTNSKGSPTYEVRLPLNTANGMCGSVILSVVPKHIAVVAIHVAGYTGTPHCAMGAFNLFDVECAFNELNSKFVLSPHIDKVYLQGIEIDTSHPVPLKSSVNWLDTECEELSKAYTVLGGTLLGDKTERLRGQTKTSPLYAAMVGQFGEPDTGPCKYGQPEWHSSQPALQHAGVSHDFDQIAMDLSRASLLRFHMENIHLYHGVVPFTKEQACKGLDSRPYVNGLNYNSSMGLPYNKSKIHYSYVDPADNKRILTQEILDKVDTLIARLSVPGAGMEVVGEFKYKDEATKLVESYEGGSKPKDARVYVCYPVELQIVMAMVLGPLGEAMNYNPEAFMACVGLDVTSHDATLIAKIATKFEPKDAKPRVVNGDYKHYDQSSTPEVTVDSLVVNLKVAEEIAYPKWAIEVIKNLIVAFSFPVVIVNGVLTVVPGMTTSGHGFTIHANNGNNRLYLGYGFYAELLERGISSCEHMVEVESCGKVYKVPDFNKVVSIVTQGDDHIGTVDERYGDCFNMTTLQKQFAKANIGYTDASKSEVNKAGDFFYSELGNSLDKLFVDKQAEFLKRRFVKVSISMGGKVVETVASPIAFRSVTKSLYWKGSFEADHEWAEQVIHGSLREMFFYGESIFEEFKGLLEGVVEKAGLGTFASPMKTFDDLARGYAATLCDSGINKDIRIDPGLRMRVFHEDFTFAPRVDLYNSFVILRGGVKLEDARKLMRNKSPGKYVVTKDDLEVDDHVMRVENGMKLSEATNETIEEYVRLFPDPKGEILCSLYKETSPKYIPPPRGR